MTSVSPVVNDPSLLTTPLWADEFKDSALPQWNKDDFISGKGDHRTGSKYIQLDGTVNMAQNWTALPARWAGLYDKHRDEVQFTRDGHLVMRGYALNEPNLWRDSYTDPQGRDCPFGDWLIYAPWLSTLGRRRVDGAWEVDPAKTTLTLTRGSVLEVRANFENQRVSGGRLSGWLFPVEGAAYDEDVSEVEIDIFEVCSPASDSGHPFGGKALMKVVGGNAGDTPQDIDENGVQLGSVDLLKRGIDLRKGWHTFTLVWRHDGTLEFYCDGILCNVEKRSITMVAYFILSREFNSGIKSLDQEKLDALSKLVGRADTPFTSAEEVREFINSQPDTPAGISNIQESLKVVKPYETYSNGPKMPRDDGITAENCIHDVVNGIMNEKDESLIDYVRAWTIVSDDSTKPPKIDEPDIDVGNPDVIDGMSLEEQIIMLSASYERAEVRIRDQALQIAAKEEELKSYRETTDKAIENLQATEARLMFELEEAKKKSGPVISPSTLSKLRSILLRIQP